MRKFGIILSLTFLVLFTARPGNSQSDGENQCSKLGRAASWIILIGYGPDESPEEVFERSNVSVGSGGMLEDLPWEKSRLLEMITGIQSVDVVFAESDDSMRLAFQYGRYFEYQCQFDSEQFLPFVEAKPVIDRCITDFGEDISAFDQCVISQTMK